MEKDQIKLSDLQRIIIGEVPPVFFLEIVLRAIVVYAILMIAFRLMGTRMASRLNRIEQAALVTLAAAIGIPIQAPDRGLVPPVIIAVVIVASNRLIAWKAARNERFETFSQGKIDTLVEDGVLCVKDIRKTTLTRERIFAQLRSKQIIQLGEVNRLYFESNGSFTLLKAEEPKAGLAILPEYDQVYVASLPTTNNKVCKCCGYDKNTEGQCENCGYDDWVPAVKSIKAD